MARQGAPEGGNRGGQAPGHRPASRPATSARVYRRRRAVFGCLVLLVLLGLVAGVIAVVGALNAGPAAQTASGSTASPPGSAAGASASASSTSGSAPSAAPTAQGGPVCNQSLVTVSAAVDAPVYVAGQNPVLTLKVTNRGKAPCTVNVGTSQMEYLVTSGSDRIFDSKDCQIGGADRTKTLAPGASETAKFPWQRTRTAPGCTPVTAIPQPGYYTFQATLGQRTSNKVAFELQ